MSIREEFYVKATVISQKGNCGFGHEVGDKVYFDRRTIKGEICYNALFIILPRIWAMMRGLPEGVISNVACPDAINPVVFELKKIKRRSVECQRRR